MLVIPRICTLKLATDNFDMVLINVHSPTKDKDELEKELLYETLEDFSILRRARSS